jgi:hypothetical protein
VPLIVHGGQKIEPGEAAEEVKAALMVDGQPSRSNLAAGEVTPPPPDKEEYDSWTLDEWKQYGLKQVDRAARAEAALAAGRAQTLDVQKLAQGVIDEYSPCEIDESRPALQWCRTHSTKRCTQKATFELALRLSSHPTQAALVEM